MMAVVKYLLNMEVSQILNYQLEKKAIQVNIDSINIQWKILGSKGFNSSKLEMEEIFQVK